MLLRTYVINLCLLFCFFSSFFFDFSLSNGSTAKLVVLETEAVFLGINIVDFLPIPILSFYPFNLSNGESIWKSSAEALVNFEAFDRSISSKTLLLSFTSYWIFNDLPVSLKICNTLFTVFYVTKFIVSASLSLWPNCFTYGRSSAGVSHASLRMYFSKRLTILSATKCDD